MWKLGATLLLAGALAGCGSPMAAPKPTPTPKPTAIPTYTLRGTLDDQNGCLSSDVEGANVVIRDQDNRVIASTTTSRNVNHQKYKYVGRVKLPDFDCIVRFTATVPKAVMYQTMIGAHAAPVYSFAQMQRMRWHVNLVLNATG